MSTTNSLQGVNLAVKNLLYESNSSGGSESTSVQSDKLSSAQARVEDVRIQMQENVRKMVENQTSAIDLEGKSDDIKNTAFEV
mmetsp:Transcript_21331/g.15310  ORF Transcript_21331/g.15310 Transcript_21331/m.15310 type:complete len:83 (-) Transcript_21331:172-420(-)